MRPSAPVWSHHHQTPPPKVVRLSGVLREALSAFVEDRAENWDELIPLVEFAHNDSASVLGCGYTPFFMDRGQHPRRPMALPGEAGASASSVGEDWARLMDHVTGEVRGLLKEVLDARKLG